MKLFCDLRKLITIKLQCRLNSITSSLLIGMMRLWGMCLLR